MRTENIFGTSICKSKYRKLAQTKGIICILKNIALLLGLWFQVGLLQAQAVLQITGKEILSPSGNPVFLRGVNLGGWLVTENWMCGITDTTDTNGRSALAMLESRFSAAQVAQLQNAWQDNWITSADLDTIQSLGFNFVRVPFGWRNLQDKNRQWNLDNNGNIDFSRFDWIVNQAAQRNLYVMFDYHIWLDQEIAYNSISDVDSVKLHTTEIWKAVASHFNNNPTVIAYDLLNEPTGSWNDHIMQMIYDSVRTVDATHIISMEWTNPNPNRWQNVLYQDHFYGLNAPTFAQNQALFNANYLPIFAHHDSLNVPFYVGELHTFDSDTTLAWSLNQYCLNDIHWSPWTYKTVNMWGWGLISVYPNNVSVNVATDSFSTILNKWSQLSNPNNWYEMTNLKTIWREAANCLNTPNTTAQALSSTFLLYPNPSSNYLNVEVAPSAIGSRYHILNTLGMTLFSAELTTENTEIPLYDLSDGLYFFVIEGNENVVKFVKH